MKVFFDTNVLLAACIEEHEHHGRAVPLLASVHRGQNTGFASGHSALEAYSAMTRMPRSPRIMAAQAMVIVQENVLKHLTLIALTGKEYGELLLKLGVEGTLGGQVYDALHLACAEKCGAERIYTFNVRHFQSLAGEGLRAKIMAP